MKAPLNELIKKLSSILGNKYVSVTCTFNCHSRQEHEEREVSIEWTIYWEGDTHKSCGSYKNFEEYIIFLIENYPNMEKAYTAEALKALTEAQKIISKVEEKLEK